MNLYDLAHHPDAYDARLDAYEEFGAFSKSNSTDSQFHLLLDNVSEEGTLERIIAIEVLATLTENEYRMFLLFIHWSTES